MTADREIAYVRVLSGPQKGGVFVLRGHSVYAIGRGEGCQLRVDDPALEVRHGFITQEDGAWTFRDPQRYGNCFVNDIPTHRRNLEGGEVVRIGKRVELFFTFNRPQPRTRTPEERLARVEEAPLAVPRAPGAPSGLEEEVGTLVAPLRPADQEEVPSETARAEQRAAEQTARPLRLVVVDGDPRDIGKELVLDEDGVYLLGRCTDCDLPLHDKKMSREHCRVERVGETCRVSDLNSLNGTVVNGLRAASTRFGAGDYIRVGFTVLAAQRVRAAETT